MTWRDAVRFLVWTIGFALVTATGGWLAVPVSAAFWALLTPAAQRRELLIALAAAAAWGLLILWGMEGASTARLLSLLAGIFRVPGWTLVLLTLAIPALLAWSAAVIASDAGAAVVRRAIRRRPQR